MEEILIIKYTFLALIILLFPVVLIFFLRKNCEEIDYDKYIKLMKEQTNNNLERLDKGNKEITMLNNKILNCKKKLGRPFYKVKVKK